MSKVFKNEDGQLVDSKGKVIASAIFACTIVPAVEVVGNFAQGFNEFASKGR